MLPCVLPFVRAALGLFAGLCMLVEMPTLQVHIALVMCAVMTASIIPAMPAATLLPTQCTRSPAHPFPFGMHWERGAGRNRSGPPSPQSQRRRTDARLRLAGFARCLAASLAGRHSGSLVSRVAGQLAAD